MRPFRSLISFFVHLALFALSIDRVYYLHKLPAGTEFARAPGVIDSLFSSMPELLRADTVWRHELWWGALGVLVVFSWVLSVMSLFHRPRALRVKTSQGDSILLDPGAIKNFTKTQVDAHPSVTSHRVRVRQVGGKSVAITAHVSVIPTLSLPEIKRELESAIRDGFSQVLGIENIDNISIILNLDEKYLNTRPGPAGKAEPPVPVPVRAAIEPAPEVSAEAPDLTFEHGDSEAK